MFAGHPAAPAREEGKGRTCRCAPDCNQMNFTANKMSVDIAEEQFVQKRKVTFQVRRTPVPLVSHGRRTLSTVF